MRFIKSLAILLLLLLITSCYDYSDEGKYWYEEWTATMNIDGSEIDYLLKGAQTPFYVADLSNPGQEKIIMSSSNSVYSLNPEGTLWEGILLDVGNIVEISQDRTKMVMEYNYDIYVANVDGSNLIQITNTPDIREHDASISADNSQIVYSRYINNQDVRSETLFIYDLTNNTETELIREENDNYINISDKCIVSDKVFYLISSSPDVKPDGLYCYDIITGIDSLVYNDNSLVDIITDYENSVYLLQASRTLLQIDINSYDSQVLYIEPTQRYYNALVLDPSKENICLCDSGGFALMYFLQTGDFINFGHELGKVSFNKNSTRIISMIERRHPDDF